MGVRGRVGRFDDEVRAIVKRVEGRALAEDDPGLIDWINAQLRRECELRNDRWNETRTIHVPFQWVAKDALNPYSGSTEDRPSYRDPAWPPNA